MAKTHRLGPGELHIGETATEIDISCQVTNVTITPSFDEGDSETTLCGDEVTGEQTTTRVLSFNAFQDWSVGGINAFAHEHNGEEHPFTFVPDDGGTTITGTVKVRELPLGGNTRERLKAEAEWPIVGNYTPVWEPAG